MRQIKENNFGKESTTKQKNEGQAMAITNQGKMITLKETPKF